MVTGDIRDPAALEAAFAGRGIDAVIHLAGLKAVGESVEQPLRYFDVNVGGAVALFEAMGRHGVRRLVFSSSATVYGTPETNPIPEAAPLNALNPYGRTKLKIEQTIDDLVVARPEVAASSLRYFNRVGRRVGADRREPKGVPNNLFPYIAQTAAGIRERLRIFGGDYPTPDGTGVREYIHVVDLARGHLAALDFLLGGREAAGRNLPVNLGCGRGYSVLESVEAFARAVGRPIPTRSSAAAPATSRKRADPRRAEELFGWRASAARRMCADHWAYQSRDRGLTPGWPARVPHRATARARRRTPRAGRGCLLGHQALKLAVAPASKVSVQPPTCTPPTNTWGMVGVPMRLPRAARILAAEIPLLVSHEIEVDGPEFDARRVEETPDRPAELAPFEREEHDWRRGVGQHQLDEGHAARARLTPRRLGRRSSRRGCDSPGSRRPAPPPPPSSYRGCPGRAASSGCARRCRAQ